MPDCPLSAAVLRRTLWLATIASAALVVGQTALAEDEADEEDAFRQPGIAARYFAGDATEPAFARGEPLPALLLAAGESVDPRLPAGGWRSEWSGVIEVLQPGDYRFFVRQSGAFDLSLDGRPMEWQAGPDETTRSSQSIALSFGFHPFTARFRPGGGDRPQALKLLWQSEAFSLEPVPPHAFGHLPDDKEFATVGDAFPAGRLAVEEHGCVACHRSSPQVPISSRLLARLGPKLSRAGARLQAAWIYRWLDDPQAFRPEAVMPRMFAADRRGEVERHAVATLLASLGGPLKPSNAPPSGPDEPLVAHGRALYEQTGCVVCHERQDGAPPRATLARLSQKTTYEALSMFLRDVPAVDPSGRMPDFGLIKADAEGLAMYLLRRDSEQSPPLEIPAAPTSEEIVDAAASLTTDAALVGRLARQPLRAQLTGLGRLVMESRNCAACHEVKLPGDAEPWQPRPAHSDFAAIADSQKPGCLAPADAAPTEGIPGYGAALDRVTVREFLAASRQASSPSSPGHEGLLALERFNCLGCHQRNGQGGLGQDLSARLLAGQTAESAEMIVPPPLTGATGKLLAPYLRAVLETDRRSRPWMQLRMPRFGRDHIGHLPAALAALDGEPLDEQPFQPPAEAELIQAGRTLVGARGFGCAKCHDMLGVASRGTRGPDLAQVGERVNYDWFVRWMTDPQRLQPGTRMPTVFLNGQSAHQDILDGAPDRQRLAIWHYLLASRDVPPPEGLEDAGPTELATGGRPLVFRTFLPGVTPRSAALRFDNGAYLAYDLQACRLAYGWSGDFLDTEPVWGGRGGNKATPKGPVFWTAPEGFPWDVAASAGVVPDFAGRGSDTALGAELPHDGQLHPSRLRFRGYSVADSGPVFRYVLNLGEGRRAAFRETVRSLETQAAWGAEREFVVTAPAGGVAWLNVAILDGDATWRRGDGRHGTLDDEHPTTPADAVVQVTQQGRPLVLRLRNASDGVAWRLSRQGGATTLLVRVPIGNEPAEGRLTLRLQSPRDDRPETLGTVLAGELQGE